MPALPSPHTLTRLRPSTKSTAFKISTTIRTFTTTLPSRTRKGYKQPLLDPPIPTASSRPAAIPAYPPGPRPVYHQSNTGLYGTARIRFGHNVAPKHGGKTPRKWRPNVQSRRLWSAGLQARIRTRVTTRVLRTIDKVGGLDAYLLGSKPARIQELGPWGWKLRWRLMQAPAVQAAFRAEREALGVPPEGLLALQEAEKAAQLAEQAGGWDALVDETQPVLDGEEEIELGVMEEEGFMKEDMPRKTL